MPGAGELRAGTFGPVDLAAVDTTLDAIEEKARQVELAIAERVQAPLQRAEALASELTAIIQGSITTKLNRQEQTAQKMARKMLERVEQHLHNGYSYAYPLGARYPNQEDVLYGLQTGDYTGSMGLTPVAGDPAPTPAEGPGNGLPYPISPEPIGDIGGVEVPDPGFVEPLPPPMARPIPQPPANQPPPTFVPLPPPLARPIPPPGKPGPPPFGDQPQTWPQDRSGYCVNPSAANAWWHTMPPGPIAPGTWPADPNGWAYATSGYDNTLYAYDVWCFHWCNEFSPGSFYFFTPKGMKPTFDVNGRVIASASTPDAAVPLIFTHCGTRELIGEPPTEPPTEPPGEQPPGGGTCPVPSTPECPVDQVDWNLLLKLTPREVCDAIQGAVDRLPESELKPSTLLGMGTGKKPSGIAASIIQAIAGADNPMLPDFIRRFGPWLDTIVSKALKGVDCDLPKMTAVSLASAALQFVEKWTGAVPDQVLKQVEIISNTVCQSVLPSGADADSAYLADTIKEHEWECYHKAAGDHIGPAADMMQAKRTRPDAAQLAMLFRRKQITEDEYRKATRANGVINKEDEKRIFDLTQSWPGLPDVVRFMVRDVADQDAVRFGKLDEDFEAKFAGKLKDYAAANGVDEELAKYYWRAHWQLPSFTMLREMLFRLRPGKVDDALMVDKERMKKALKQDDWAPGWVDRMIEIAFLAINQTDAKMYYHLHAITEEELEGYFMDEGYTKEDAQVKVKAEKNRRKVNEIRKSGLPTTRMINNQFARGLITERELTDLAAKITLNKEQAQAIIDAAKLAKTVRDRQIVSAAVRGGYLRGLYDDGEAIAKLVNGGFDADSAIDLVNQWRDEREARGKIPTAAKLCLWRGLGVLNRQEQLEALDRIGWEPEDARRIVAECDYQWQQKAQKAAEKAQREILAELEKRRKAEEKARKEAEKAAIDALPCKPRPKPPCPPDQKNPDQDSDAEVEPTLKA